jgi:hypothetical protein
MMRGNMPAAFAYPAGIGDIIVGLLALYLIVTSWNKNSLPRRGVIWLAVL